MNRRELIAKIALITGGCLASGFVQAALRGATLHVPPAKSALNAQERKMVEQLAELIIPRTDTPGAIDAGVPVFIDQVVSSWYTPLERTIFRDGLTSLDTYCLQNWRKPFIACATGQQTQALTVADESTRDYRESPTRRIREAPEEHSPFFFKLKLLTVLGYYTSEVGSMQELRYDPVPGKYAGDVDFDKLGRQWSW